MYIFQGARTYHFSSLWTKRVRLVSFSNYSIWYFKYISYSLWSQICLESNVQSKLTAIIWVVFHEGVYKVLMARGSE